MARSRSMTNRAMTSKADKPKSGSGKQKAAFSNEDDKLPPARAAAQAEREARLRQLVTGSLIDKIKK